MDHEYSISGNICDVDCFAVLGANEELLFTSGACSLVISKSKNDASESKALNISLKDRSCAAAVSEEGIVNLCCELSKRFHARVHLEKLHEEYGVANVFNGGSDYEVVRADCFSCEFMDGTEICCQKREF